MEWGRGLEGGVCVCVGGGGGGALVGFILRGLCDVADLHDGVGC